MQSANEARVRQIKFSPRRIGHANLFVGDLERSIRFYRDICGFDLVFREPHLTMGFLSNGNTHHDLGLVEITERQLVGRDGHVQVVAGRASKPGLNHFGWEMENERALVDAFERARQANLGIVRMSDHQISHSIYINDPDGNMHEFYADQMKDWRQLFNGTSGPAITSAWNPKAAPPTTDSRYPVGIEATRVPKAIIHPLRFTHAVLITPTSENMEAFFVDVAGLTVKERSDHHRVTYFGGGASGQVFDMAVLEIQGARGVHHYSFQVASEVELASGENGLVASGVRIEKRIDNEHKRSLFIRDPDGMMCEFYSLRNGSPIASLNRHDLSPFDV